MTDPTKHPKQLLLIGSGGYIEQTILPALTVVADQYHLAAIVNQSGQLSERVQQLSGNQQAITDLTEIDFTAIEVIFICIPHLLVPALLQRLIAAGQSHLTRCTVWISTPVFGMRDHRHRRLFKAFGQVLAFENSFCLPPYRLAKQLIAQQAIGPLQLVSLQHSAYRYHGLALIRDLFSVQPAPIQPASIQPRSKLAIPSRVKPRWGRSIHYGGYFEYRFSFGNNRHGVIIEPKDYPNGRFLLVGERGMISDYPLTASAGGGDGVEGGSGDGVEGGSGDGVEGGGYQIGYLQNPANIYCGLTLNGKPQPINALDQLFIERLPYPLLADPSLFRQLHIRAAVEIFNGFSHQQSHCLYPAAACLFDNLALTLCQRVGYYLGLL